MQYFFIFKKFLKVEKINKNYCNEFHIFTLFSYEIKLKLQLYTQHTPVLELVGLIRASAIVKLL